MEANLDTEKFDKVLEGSNGPCLSSFFNNEELSDVILVAGDSKFYAHRFVMAKWSSVFKTMLYEKHWPESVGEEVTVKETPECQAVFDLFIKYLYTHVVSVNIKTAVGIILLADKYDVTFLKDLCVSYMVEQSHLVQIETAVSWYTWAKDMDFKTLATACFEAITLNTKSLIKSTMWVDLGIDFLDELLSSSELVIGQEYDLFVGLSQWLLVESRVESLKEHSKRLLPLIRFPQIQTDELLEVEKSQLTTHTESSGILSELIGRAFRFRALCPTHYSPDFCDDFYIPRDYLTLNVIYRGQGFRSSFIGKEFYIEKQAKPIVVTVEANMGPVMSEDLRNGIWVISSIYKDSSVWKVQFKSKDMLGKKVNIQFSLLVTDIGGKVIQCERLSFTNWKTGQKYETKVELSHSDKACYLLILIKPIPPGDLLYKQQDEDEDEDDDTGFGLFD